MPHSTDIAIINKHQEIKDLSQFESEPLTPKDSNGEPTSFSSLGEIKNKAPALYQKMLEGMAMDICRQMQKHQSRLKQIMRENH